MKKTWLLSEWIVRSFDCDSYRAGTLNQRNKHPVVDQKMIEAIGGLRTLILQAEELEQDSEIGGRGLFSAQWINLRDDIKKIDYNAKIVPILCKRLGWEEPRERQMQCIALVEDYRKEVEHTWAENYYINILERLKKGHFTEDYRNIALFNCLNRMVNLKEPVFIKIFSSFVCKNSKDFKDRFQSRIINIIAKYSPIYEEKMTDEEVLSAHNLLSYSQQLEWKGSLQYSIDGGQMIDSALNRYGTVINSQTMEHAEVISIENVKVIRIIENKANYEAMSYQEDILYIYCHGFFSPKEQVFLRKMVKLAKPDVSFEHWGDMDYGGIRIYHFNKKNVFPKLKPYKMDRNSYLDAVSRGAGIPIKPDKMEKLRKMDVEELQELKECILQYKMEIEQEILLAENL